MASQCRNCATNRTMGFAENSDADEPSMSAYSNTRDCGPHERAMAGFGQPLPVSPFDRLQESHVEPQVFQEYSTNIAQYSDSGTYLPTTSTDCSRVMNEDYGEVPEHWKTIPYQNATDLRDEVGYDQTFNVTTSPEHYNYLPIYRSMGDSVTFNRSQTLFRADTRPQMPTLTAHYAGPISADSGVNTDSLEGSIIDTGTSPPQRRPEDSYQHLECNYKFIPRPTKEEIQALSILVKLSYDEVQEFFRKKSSEPVTHLYGMPQLEEGPSIANRAKRHRGSDSSSFEFPDPIYGTSQKSLAIRPHSSPKNAIPRVVSLSSSSRKLSQKPYYCTWQTCRSSFSSKSDWKRHEEVHVPQWLWVCTFDPLPNGKRFNTAPCTRKFKRDDHLREHLKNYHNCTDSTMVTKGREPLEPKSYFNSQCGFCGVFTPEWLDRIDHVAEHFRAGKHISDWKEPWPEDISDTGSKPSSDDDDPDTDQNGTNNSTSDKASGPRTKSGGSSRKGHSNASGDGRYSKSGGQYVRPGIFGVKYQSGNHLPSVVGTRKPRYDSHIIDENEAFNPFWRQMRSLFKHMAMRRGTGATSVHGMNKANSKTTPGRERQCEEQIEFYCILCLKITSTDSSLESSDSSHCTCSEAAIQDHVWSLIRTKYRPPNETKSDDDEYLKQKKPKIQLSHAAPEESFERDTLFKRHLLHAVGGLPVQENELKRLATMNDDQFPNGTDADAESLSYTMNRYLKLNSSAAEGDSEWTEIPGGGKSLRNSPPIGHGR